MNKKTPKYFKGDKTMTQLRTFRNVFIAVFFGLMLSLASNVTAEHVVTEQLVPGVEVTKFTYQIATHKMLKKYKKGSEQEKPVLVFDITLKNTSKKPARYQAFMIMPKEGKSTGGTIPRSTKKLVDPGAESSEQYAALLYELPHEINLIVQAVE
jgi:hypothetical protein